MKFKDVEVQSSIIAVGQSSDWVALRTAWDSRPWAVRGNEGPRFDFSWISLSGCARSYSRGAAVPTWFVEVYRAATSAVAAMTSARASGAEEGVTAGFAGDAAAEGEPVATLGCCMRISPRS